MNNSLRIWVDAARPKTLPLALVSIFTGSALAFSSGSFSVPVTLLALLTATLLQILSNLANDYGDAMKGTDNEKRLGPMRAIQSGAVSLVDMKQAMVINIVLTIAAGLALVFYSLESLHSILAFIGLGILAMLAAVAYTVGNKPYGYVGLGDLSVFLFFGLLGVSGSYFLQTGHIEWGLFLPSLGCGLMAVAVLNINNMRDIENDAECGKRTIAVRLGQQRAKTYHFLLLLGAVLSFASYLVMQDKPLWISLPFLLSAIFVLQHGRAVCATDKPAQIAPMLPVVVKCSLITNLLFVGVVIAQTLTS
ncbi:1,4-dihydroxy-2-naphthoate polyprenyltransferase [Vibrio sp. V27_P1S3P104]|uniref:1,4-dihydroxy-2-naphthoate polyprenyltransferase n=1 Tax=Vibrio TaxID=662 RepID=UPI000C167E00|nr:MULTISPECIES: 1,4-dihydroxy-2-naphthoate polyprenyltransferase [Vibrio]NAW70743.1 1,4-dihydroxy-2-naphthoate polyprenyltransferase [Vibrio sp. V28_P6S34P95]NAX05935.1 1,4-dihydroxy-2-naphthoate polyprenyltransferase [Vibrio sp. V30_P3S12P165]NAX35598.1 1,4-dihydroxy-2-naphthoate polyprenyltransferase [Vibrio sp. V29_P1S30P107]NAX37756.1 1,4-dihydroxy-2-naphthoate polyprenyltransferase [Vibrio sp. V27_P1S3P104]NAX39584.1 1,4-dihydroxy-2-naphthoate polyprenyltransferase [Vibrio sp. V26_P1S5P1